MIGSDDCLTGRRIVEDIDYRFIVLKKCPMTVGMWTRHKADGKPTAHVCLNAIGRQGAAIHNTEFGVLQVSEYVYELTAVHPLQHVGCSSVQKRRLVPVCDTFEQCTRNGGVVTEECPFEDTLACDEFVKFVIIGPNRGEKRAEQLHRLAKIPVKALDGDGESGFICCYRNLRTEPLQGTAKLGVD